MSKIRTNSEGAVVPLAHIGKIRLDYRVINGSIAHEVAFGVVKKDASARRELYQGQTLTQA